MAVILNLPVLLIIVAISTLAGLFIGYKVFHRK